MGSVYPARERTAWILGQRAPRARTADPWMPHGIFLEEERMASGQVATSGVVLLTNKECPWRCLMCDLWKDTTTTSVPSGAVAHQVGRACQVWAEAEATPRQVKLYNSGSFFDEAAIPHDEYGAIAARVSFAENVVVESHPRLVGAHAARLRDLLPGGLEVAMGLETAHPEVLHRLNKGFSLDHFARASAWLKGEGIAMRAFLLVHPPFMGREEALEWTVKSAQFAYSCGATAVSLIPTRTGNGAMERLLASGEFELPTLGALEEAQRRTLALGLGRVLADTWGLRQFSQCAQCFEARERRLQAVNLAQRDMPPVSCPECGGT